MTTVRMKYVWTPMEKRGGGGGEERVDDDDDADFSTSLKQSATRSRTSV
jgi:hypothetical protein